MGAATGPHHAYHYAEVLGANGQRVGRVRYGFTFRRPMDDALRAYKAQVGRWYPGLVVVVCVCVCAWEHVYDQAL